MLRKFSADDKLAIVNFCFEKLGYSRQEAFAALRRQEQSSLRMDLAKSNLNGLLAGGEKIDSVYGRRVLVKESFDLADEMLKQEDEE